MPGLMQTAWSPLVAKMKSLLFIHTSSPHSGIRAQEGLDALLMGSAFADCSALFVGEGILQLLKNQDTGHLGQKNFSYTFGALLDYGVEKIFCSRTQLQHYGIDNSDLMLDVIALADEEISALFSSNDVILNF